MNKQAVLTALADCPGLIRGRFADGEAGEEEFCVMGWLGFKAGGLPQQMAARNGSGLFEMPQTILKINELFNLELNSSEAAALVGMNNHNYSSPAARLAIVRAYIAGLPDAG